MVVYLVVMFFGYSPNIYVIDSCNKYHKEMLIFSKTTEKGLKLSFGTEHCYVLNDSDSDVNITTLIYAKPNYEPLIYFKTLNERLNTKSEKEFEIENFHIILKIQIMRFLVKVVKSVDM
jgi:hypothetical protein